MDDSVNVQMEYTRVAKFRRHYNYGIVRTSKFDADSAFERYKRYSVEDHKIYVITNGYNQSRFHIWNKIVL